MSYTQRHSHESLPPRPRSEYKEKKETYIFFYFYTCFTPLSHLTERKPPSWYSRPESVCDGRVSTFLLSHFRVSCFFLSYARLRIRKHATIHAHTHTHIHACSSLISLFFFFFLISLFLSLSFSTQHDFAFISFLIDRFSHFSRSLLLAITHTLTRTHARTRFSVASINKIVCNNV